MDTDGKGGRRVRLWRLLVPGIMLLLIASLSFGSTDAPRTGLRVGGDAHYPPYHFLDERGAADGVVVGMAVLLPGREHEVAGLQQGAQRSQGR